MKHVVLGGGNLGLDLMKRGMQNDDDEFKLFTASQGFKYPTSLDPILDELPDHVWVAIGAGSVEGAVKDFTPYADLHIRLVMELAQKLPPHVWLHTFSTNYVLESAMLSLYAFSKHTMEKLLTIMDRPKTRAYRVQSLYGWERLSKCFPVKVLMQNQSKKGKIPFPTNPVTPTPTAWLAEQLIQPSDWGNDNSGFHIRTVVPGGSVPTHEWAQLILGDGYKVVADGLDPYRPCLENCNCAGYEEVNTDHWRDLWDKHWVKQKSIRRRLELQMG